MIGPHKSGYLYTITKKCYGSTVMVSYGNTMVQNEYNIHATCYPVQTSLKSLSIYLSVSLMNYCEKNLSYYGYFSVLLYLFLWNSRGKRSISCLIVKFDPIWRSFKALFSAFTDWPLSLFSLNLHERTKSILRCMIEVGLDYSFLIKTAIDVRNHGKKSPWVHLEPRWLGLKPRRSNKPSSFILDRCECFDHWHFYDACHDNVSYAHFVSLMRCTNTKTVKS